jgi:hypothetical protein
MISSFQLFLENMQSNHKIWAYHITQKDRLPSILETGLLLNSENNLTYPEGEWAFKIYGCRPIYVSLKKPFISKKNRSSEDVLLKIDITGIDLVADLQSMVSDGYYWDSDSNYIRVNEDTGSPHSDEGIGRVAFESLLNPYSWDCEAAIEHTGTAAILENIPLQKIKIIK